MRERERNKSYTNTNRSVDYGSRFSHPLLANRLPLLIEDLGIAVMALPNTRGDKLVVDKKRSFWEIYNADKFLASLSGVVRVDKNPPNRRIPTMRVPNRVSEELIISSKIKPIIFQSKRNIQINVANVKRQVKHQSNTDQCLPMFESLKLQHALQELADLMEPMPETPIVQYDGLKVSNPSIIMILYEINYGHWLEQDEAIQPRY
ncbi:hypothetical protein CASFOL_012073 [Castilleja foliolosa]|uniref:Uncharacterized protein n=1 Tax=Castilleja foliolosa TaxID=1961234 RepID=A0ABD3DTG6_9LAMI